MRSNVEWQHWGRVDPLWAVDAQPGKQAGGPNAWTPEEFLARGRIYFSDVRRQWQQYGMGGNQCVEIGCGAGRITNQLLDCFERVVALDVSQHQVDLAKRLLGQRSDRVDFHIVTEPQVPVLPDSCDGMFSTEVVQHFSEYEMLSSYLRGVFTALGPNGTICFQTPVIGIHQRSTWRYGLRMIALSCVRAAGARRIMEYRYYSAPRIFCTLESLGYVDCELRVFPVGGHDGRHAYFFARKPATSAV